MTIEVTKMMAVMIIILMIIIMVIKNNEYLNDIHRENKCDDNGEYN